MAHYLGYATKARASSPRELLAEVRTMLTIGLWGIPTTAQLRTKVLPGDGLIVAVGAPYRQFVGDAVLVSRYRRFFEEELALLPPGLSFDHGVGLARGRIWQHQNPIAELWPRTTAAKRDPKGTFLGAIRRLQSVDAALLIAIGMRAEDAGVTGGAAEATVVPGEARALAHAGDDEVIALMNARRVEKGKVPLTPE
jgi:hypothetical protein